MDPMIGDPPVPPAPRRGTPAPSQSRRRRGRSTHSLVRLALVLAATAVGAACDSTYEGGGDLRAQRVVLEREVEGLRPIVQRLERGEPLLPADDVAVAVDEGLVRELLLAQLPFEMDVDRFHVQLTDVDVQFRGSPTLQLRGRLQVRDQPDVTAAITLFGALDDVRIEAASSRLRATVAADHLTVADATGLAGYLSGATLDEMSRQVRLAMQDRLPQLRIPVSVRQELDLPAVTDGPVRLAAARLPLDVAVSQVVTTAGRLWISIRITPGDLGPPPAAGGSAR